MSILYQYSTSIDVGLLEVQGYEAPYFIFLVSLHVSAICIVDFQVSN